MLVNFLKFISTIHIQLYITMLYTAIFIRRFITNQINLTMRIN